MYIYLYVIVNIYIHIYMLYMSLVLHTYVLNRMCIQVEAQTAKTTNPTISSRLLTQPYLGFSPWWPCAGAVQGLLGLFTRANSVVPRWVWGPWTCGWIWVHGHGDGTGSMQAFKMARSPLCLRKFPSLSHWGLMSLSKVYGLWHAHLQDVSWERFAVVLLGPRIRELLQWKGWGLV